jgi:fatty acid hydroxylase domain-containing protein 2
VIAPMILNFLHWISIGVAFVLQSFQWTQKYKIQQDASKDLTSDDWKTLLSTILFNQFIVLPSFLAAVYYSITFINDNAFFDFTYVPSFPRLFLNIIIGMMIYEIQFYYYHRLLHHSQLYKHIHKKHHKYKSPIAIVGQYQHPVEYVICDLVTGALPAYALRMDMPLAFLLMIVLQFFTIFEHCGYNLPFLLSPEVHDYHHAHFKECYSTYGLMDYLHGTCEEFQKSARFEKHKTLP